MTAGRSATLLVILAFALPALALVVSLPPYPMIFGVLNNAAHAPVFGALAVVLLMLIRRYTAWPKCVKYSCAFGFAIAVGGVIELIQPLFSRGGEIVDLRTDALGAAAGLALVAFISLPRRWLSALVFAVTAGAALVPVAAASLGYWQRTSQFPTVMDFSSNSDRYFIQMQDTDGEIAALPERFRREQDPPSLRVQIAGQRWPGVAHIEPQPDWRGYSRLMLDLTNPDEQPLTLTLRVHDLTHDNRASDRFNRTFTLAPATRTELSVPLTDIAQAPDDRELDLASVAGLILFSEGEPELAEREYYLTRIWLE